MVRLALPGLVMVEAECLAFEVLTLAASYFGTTHLAAQSVLATLTCITFQYVFFKVQILSENTFPGTFPCSKNSTNPPLPALQVDSQTTLTPITPSQNPLPNLDCRLDPNC